MKLSDEIINKPYDTKGKTDGVCWEFCKEVSEGLPDKPYLGMVKIEMPQVGCVVMFQARRNKWHAGIVWPDGLHFVHVAPEKNGTWYVRKERLTKFPWNRAVEGFYVPCK